MKNSLLYFIAVLLAAGCAKKENITPEVVEIISPVTEKVDSSLINIESTFAVNSNPSEEIESNLSESLLHESQIGEEEKLIGVLENAEGEIKPENKESSYVSEPQTSLKKDLDFDQLLPDSIWTEYMTKRGDYLSLIAYKEYQNANEWRRIYEWNKKHWEERGIGPDKDNPNFIYPYRELDLKKPAHDAIEWAYDHYIHVVDDGETFWSIAKQEYGDELAWVVLFWDNDKLLDNHDGKLLPGMELKIRSELWPELD